MEEKRMKRTGCLFDQICSFANLYEAYRKAIRGSGKTEDACRFSFYLEKELLQLKRELECGDYRPAPYRYFKIFDPKERTISVAPFLDRVVHHALVRVIEPVFERAFIFDSYATRKGKGSHAAVERAQEFLKKYPWYLKLDVQKYFDGIDHEILMELISRKIKDRKVLELARQVIANSDRSRGLEKGKGLPIGNLTSQFFANVYLDPLDHFIKDKLGIKGYIRYMDDLVIFSESKDELKRIFQKVKTKLSEGLQLRLKDKATFLNSRLHGLPFLGFRVFPKMIRIRTENVRRFKKGFAARICAFRNGRISEGEFAARAQSMFAWLAFADSYQVRKEILATRADVV
jgi:RNA-directed DNA polymerase